MPTKIPTEASSGTTFIAELIELNEKDKLVQQNLLGNHHQIISHRAALRVLKWQFWRYEGTYKLNGADIYITAKHRKMYFSETRQQSFHVWNIKCDCDKSLLKNEKQITTVTQNN